MGTCPATSAASPIRPEDVWAGGANLRKQLENIALHGIPAVVAINAFPGDHLSEWRAIEELAASCGTRAVVSEHFSRGGAGALELAEAVAEVAAKPSQFRLLYPDQASLREKVEAIATKVYGAAGVDYSPSAAAQLEAYEKNGYGRLPVCIAKTHLSISTDPSLLGAPTGWRMPVREARASVGAGFIYLVCGEMRTMPGLSKRPAAFGISLDESGEIVGLS